MNQGSTWKSYSGWNTLTDHMVCGKGNGERRELKAIMNRNSTVTVQMKSIMLECPTQTTIQERKLESKICEA